MAVRIHRHASAPVLFLASSLALDAGAADQPQWGQAWSRNMISTERGLPAVFDPQTGGNLRWTVRLGTESHSTPVVAGGRVYIGTNNGEPRDPKHAGDRGVLMCFDERDGKLLWQLVVPKREEDPYHDWPKSGISSPATIEGERVYIVDNRGVVLCLDTRGMANGNDGPFRDEGDYMTPRGTNAPLTPLAPGPLDADILWQFNLTTGAGIWSHDAAHSSILIHGEHLYLNTGTGVDNTHKKIRTPDAPSLVVLDKRTGKYLARDGERIAPDIFHCTWSPPALGLVDGREQILFAAGNGIVYGFDLLARSLRRQPDQTSLDADNQSRVTSAATKPGTPAILRKLWQFDPDRSAPKTNVHRFNSNRREGPSNIYGMPVFADGKIFIAGGGDWFWGKNEAWLKCFEPGGAGDLGASALRWTYPLGRHTMCTPAVQGGLVFATDAQRTLHCVDARTGQAVWTHELKGEIWASALVADGKVFVGTRRGDFWVFAASREKRLLSTVELGAPISATATAANGALYVATMTHLYAVTEQQGK
jgi:outer membrane protein assembly factor BamB